MRTLDALVGDALPLLAPDVRFEPAPTALALGSGTDALPWRYRVRVAADGVRFDDLTCRVPMGDHSMEHTVAQSTEMAKVSVRLRGQDHRLPLDETHLVGAFVGSGAVGDPAPTRRTEGRGAPGPSRYWPLPHVLDESVALVFGYEWRSGRFVPLDAGVCARLRAGTPVAWSPPLGAPVFAPVGRTSTAVLHRPRVLVVASLAVCAPAADFEPLGLLTACRLFPTVIVRANVDLEGLDATVTVRRPTEGPHGEISAALFSDDNDYQFMPPPTWDQVFGWYNLAPEGTYTLAPASGRRLVGEPSRRMAFNEYLGFRRPSAWGKEPRQGAYDNLHLAPRMPPLKAGDPGVVMAPICQHDCLHLHVRWGTKIGLPGAGDSHLRGWKDGLPYQERGAPQVPEGQEVTLTMVDSRGFDYRAVQTFARADVPHFVCHHGAAYAHSLSAIADFGPPLMGILPTREGWTEFYHRLQFVGSGTSVPRLEFPDGVDAMANA